ncbi:GTP cyclohydrolase 1 feedback regulatory protein [Cherax quadricarinatus]|uniref:GTP cyclohydrolase 1 feedback regulatory protein n=1 Tax=Cherax quadricarinatus TaxID=27406 RepID=UPI002379E24E|nr:GTP cyclohydrolase 1 feedback regulatory protein-like [Cherax quadricarinatus]
MPYLLISTQLRLEAGPTYVGDSDSDPDLMSYLGAEEVKEPTSKSFSYCTKLVPRKVLNLLEKRGWRLVTSSNIGQMCIWTLHRELD